ncbi:MAG: DUF2283 domain-containing protein [Anaerolineae bacterium]|jgi:uncharacterized protein YuzE|nr:DUF2283 domain-containing protein [Anaerolineae bacterium]
MEKNELMQIAYDRDADVLYLSVGEPRRAISREIGDDILLRLDPDTGSIIGVTILNLSTRPNLKALPVMIDLQAVPA